VQAAVYDHKPIDLLHSTHPPLQTLVDLGPDADRLGKLILDPCRIQAPVLQNTTRTRSFYGLNPRYASSPRDGTFSRPLYRRFAPLYRHCYLISYILVVSLLFCPRGNHGSHRGIPWTIAHQPSKRDDDSHRNTILPTGAKLLWALWNKLFLSAPRIRSRVLRIGTCRTSSPGILPLSNNRYPVSPPSHSILLVTAGRMWAMPRK